ncbi:hypothetical protein WN943_025710 [Citrus x changshan-huyou]
MAASKATEAMIGTLIEKVFFALLTQAQYALDFKDQLEVMKTKLELMTAFISCTDKQKTRGKFMQKILPNLRKLIYEADDIMTDCQIRDEYRKDGFCHRFSLRDLFFIYQTGKDLKHINSRIEKMESSLGVVYSCKMHDLVRDMTVQIAKDEAFCSFDEQGRQKLTQDS